MSEIKRLTEKQEWVLDLVMRSWIVRGKPPSDKEIAERLTNCTITAQTVKYHLGNLMKYGYLSSDGHRYVIRDTSSATQAVNECG
jgi:predicted transcriptional regulator